MNRSPFMTPEQSRLRRANARLRRRRRRRRRAAWLGAIALTALVATALVLALKNSSTRTTATASDSPRNPIAHANTTPAFVPPTRSAMGLPLGKPSLALQGIGEPQRDVVHTVFRDPPRAGILVNLSTGEVLWQRNPLARLHIASLTKMMTALLTVESAPPSAPVLVTRAAVNAAGSKVGVLPVGKHVRLESMLYGLLLPSGNDAAIALAQHVAGSVSDFVTRMNEQAAKLGMGCTRYSSPSGYIDAGNYSCAADLATLAQADVEQPRIARVAHTYSAELPFPIKGGKLFLYNNNPLLIYHYPGLTGLKTGFTAAAGRCLVATAERHGVRLGVVVLHSADPGTQAQELLDRGFEGVYHQAPVPEQPMPPGA